MRKLMECVPNFSEGRDSVIVEKIVDEARKIEGITILDYSSDKDHNRTVLTMIGAPDKIKDVEWKPDFGPQEMNAKSGATAVGARVPLVAFNINLDTPNVEIADKIAKKVRHLGGGLRYVKAIGLKLEERNQTQVSMNLVNYEKSAVYQAFEMVKMEARRYGVNVVGSEVIGTIPMKSLLDVAEYYLQIENFSIEQILEKRLLDEQ